MELSEYKHLFTSKPCKSAREWLLSQPDMETAWNACERGEWMIWALRNIEKIPGNEFWVKFAKRCEAQAKKYSKNADAAAAAFYADAAAFYAADAAAFYAAAAAAAADAADAAAFYFYAAAANADDAAAANAAAFYAAAANADDAAAANAAAFYAAAANADDADDAAAYERKLQAKWIRENLEYPFKSK